MAPGTAQRVGRHPPPAGTLNRSALSVLLHLPETRATQEQAIDLRLALRTALHYRQALTLAEELGMRPLQAHGHRSLGTLHAQLGQVEQARIELCTAVEMYRAMAMTFWMPQVEAVLAQMEAR